MIGYLPRTVQVGDTFRIVPNVGQHSGSDDDEAPKSRVGVVESIPPHRRFAVVKFQADGMDYTGHSVDKSIRECVDIEPPVNRVAHKEPEPGPKKPLRKDKRPIAVILQERDWSGMTSAQIAEELGVTGGGVTSAINKLAKKGIHVNYKHGTPTREKNIIRRILAKDRSGQTVEEVAAELGVTPEQVRASVQTYQYQTGEYVPMADKK
ncbi:MAG: winged helix-turn-helix transcriptional regulator [Clostridiales bacterium]|nr:winged helix-turn-helix transcriptional regulator [Clostridiales bacterium]